MVFPRNSINMSQIKDILMIIAILAVVFLTIRLGDVTGYVVSTVGITCQDTDSDAIYYLNGQELVGEEAEIFYVGKTSGKYSGFFTGGTRALTASMKDYCKDSVVVEFYCKNNYVTEKEVSCPTGYLCNNGQCVSN